MSKEELKAKAEAMGLNIALPGWVQKLIDILALVLDQLKTPIYGAKAKSDHSQGHVDLCCSCVCCAAQTLMAALECHRDCCEGC